MPSAWFWGSQESPTGPVSSKELKQLAAQGRIQPTDLIGKQGVGSWFPASKVQGLFPATAMRVDTPPVATPLSNDDSIEIIEEEGGDAPASVAPTAGIEIIEDDVPATPLSGNDSIEIIEDDAAVPAPVQPMAASSPMNTSPEVPQPADQEPQEEQPEEPENPLASAKKTLKGFWGAMKESFNNAKNLSSTKSGTKKPGKACNDCGEALGLTKWNHLKKIPEHARPDKEFLCAKCVGNYPIVCQTCGTEWRIDLDASITMCPTCKANQDFDKLISHSYDEYRKHDNWTLPFVKYGGGMLGNIKKVNAAIYKGKSRETGAYWFSMRIDTKTVMHDLNYLGIENLFIKKGELVVRIDSSSYDRDRQAPSEKAFNQKTWTMVECMVCPIHAADLAALADGEGDYAFRLEGSGFRGLDFTVKSADLDGVFRRYVDEYVRPELQSGAAEESEEVYDESQEETPSDEEPQTTTADSNPQQQTAPVQAPANDGKSSIEMLKELKELLDMGVLTPEEFEAKKAEILKRL